MERLQGWLCPTPSHRVRVVESNRRAKLARRATAGAIGLGAIALAPWVGWWTVALFLPVGVFLLTIDRRLARSHHPEVVAFVTTVAMLFVIAAAALGTGGPASPLLAWLAILPAIASLRFRWAVTRALAVACGLAILGVALTDPAAAADDPAALVAALVLLVSNVAIATALMRGELENRDRAVLDQLTGLLNRTALESRVPELEQQARVSGGSVCLVLCDVDRFKLVNDTHGHERGDAALKQAAYAIRKSLRSFELVYRVGGEELLVVLPGAALPEGLEVAERIRARFEQARPAGLELTLSAGVAAAAGEQVRYEDLFRAADEALLRAKRAGRNRVMGATALTPLAGAA